MKNIFLGIMLVFVMLCTQAQDKKNKNAKYTIEVKGNCEQCKRRIEVASYKVKGVKSAIWDVDTHQLSLILNEEKGSLSDVKKAITHAGHDAVEAKTTDENYNKLPECCKYER
ncbi:MAG: cation transporter [Flavobacterium sp.]|nr:cation transporter [Flavobacterium sp.]